MNQKYARVVLFVANRGFALKNSRKQMIKTFLDRGWQVVIVTKKDHDADELIRIGATYEEINFNRGGLNIIADIRSYLGLKKLYRKYKPNLAIHFHAKPVILGTLAAKKTSAQTKIINVITGLGHAFVKGGWLSKLAGLGYLSSLKHSSKVIFQNQDDLNLFVKQKWLATDIAKYIPSSGVDTNLFLRDEKKTDIKQNIQVVMIGRLINQKGLPDFIEVAKRVKQLRNDVSFIWVGEHDKEHPDAVNEKIIAQQTIVNFIGWQSNIKEVLAQSDILLFPSYREGFPRVVLEAASMMIPTIAYDVPGVREAVITNQTGYIIKFKDIEGLTHKLIELLDNQNLRVNLGQQARKYVENNFDSQIIHKKYFEIFSLLGFS